MTVYSGISRYMGNLPEPLRLKTNGLQPQQLRVYEDFSRIPRSQAAAIYGINHLCLINQGFSRNNNYIVLKFLRSIR